MRAALILAAAGVMALPAVAQQRLPRDVLDVIPPSERVSGGRGEMRIVQGGCRVGPTHWARRRIVEIAAQEWAAFGYQTFDARPVETRRLPDGVVAEAVNPPLTAPRQARHGVRFGSWESESRMDASIAGYWSATPDGGDVLSRQNRAWRDGEGETPWVEPWSAAFVSWVMCEAGLGEMSQFRRDIAHWRYIDQAIEARDGDALNAAYVAHDPGEAELAPGDLLCNARASSDYRSLADRRREFGEQAPSHCDVVVRVDRQARTAAVIGGNVVNGVSLTILPLVVEGDGPLRPVSTGDLDGARSYFAHLSLRADPLEDLALDATLTIRALAAR